MPLRGEIVRIPDRPAQDVCLGRTREGHRASSDNRLRRAKASSEPQRSDEVQAKRPFLVCRSHLETEHQLLSGCREDLLRKVNGTWKVSTRTIVLGANVLLDKNLSVFL